MKRLLALLLLVACHQSQPQPKKGFSVVSPGPPPPKPLHKWRFLGWHEPNMQDEPCISCKQKLNLWYECNENKRDTIIRTICDSVWFHVQALDADTPIGFIEDHKKGLKYHK